MNRWWWVSLLIGALAFYLANVTPSAKSARPDNTLVIQEPDVFMQTAEITQFQPDGAPAYQLKALEIRHFEDSGMTRLLDPALIIHQKDQPPWSARSKQGYIRQNLAPDGKKEEIVYMREEVQLERLSTGRNRIQLDSSSMYVYPERQFAETDQPVTIDTVAGRTVAQSMVADLRKGLIRMSSDAEKKVHSIVLPDQFE